MNPFNIVASVSSIEEVIEAEREGADIIELRIDMVKRPDELFFKSFSKTVDKPIIATCRIKAEGGFCEEDEQFDLLESALEFCNYVDIELSSKNLSKVRDICKDLKIKTIVSYHDFEETPPEAEMRRIIKECKDAGEMAKVAFFAKDISDVLLLEKMTMENSPIISISMGETGKISRITLPFYGSLFTYAFVGEKKAPGQFPLKELKNIFASFIHDCPNDFKVFGV